MGDGKDKNKNKNRLPILAAPAYRSGGGSGLQPDAKHVIDYLMHAAKQLVDKALRDLHRVHEASGASHGDADVAAYWDRFARAFGDPSKTHGRPRCAWFVRLRDGLRADVDACAAEWRDAMLAMTMRPEETRYPDKVWHVYARWRAIRPQLPPADALSTTTINSISAETARKFLLEQDQDLAAPPPPDLSKWELLKASFAFAHHGGQARFVWQMAGRQLQAIKALAVGTAAGAATTAPPPVPVVANMYVALRPDNGYIKRVMALEGDEDDEDDGGGGGVGLHDGQQGLQGLPSSQETDF